MYVFLNYILVCTGLVGASRKSLCLVIIIIIIIIIIIYRGRGKGSKGATQIVEKGTNLPLLWTF